MLDEVRKAVDQLSQGKVILYPTDTIWGIGCDATNPLSIEKIYRIKLRSDKKSMLVLVSDLEMLKVYVNEIPDRALEIIHSAKKPTTIVYPEALYLASNLVGEDGSVGIRVSSDPFCSRMIKAFGKPVVSTSANPSGEPSPGIFSEISPKIIHQTDHVVDWRQDETTTAAPSSVIKIDSQGNSIILRP